MMSNLILDGLRVGGSRATNIVPMAKHVEECQIVRHRVQSRKMTRSEFVNEHGSGTLRKNDRVGFNTTSHYLHERVAFEFGYPFHCIPERFVTWGEARSEGDCKPLTEVGWHVDRYATMCMFPGDEIELKFITAEIDGEEHSGVGIVVRTTSAAWVPQGYVVFCFITEWCNVTHQFLPAVNPC